MANTTFSGPVRSENGFDQIRKNSTTGTVVTDMKLSVYEATVAVASGSTTGKETAIGMPDNFIPLAATVVVTEASSNAVNLQDVGSDADTDGFIDGISAAMNSTGFKGYFACNGVLGLTGMTTTAAVATADEVEVVLSGDPGAGADGGSTTMIIKFFGISTSEDTE